MYKQQYLIFKGEHMEITNLINDKKGFDYRLAIFNFAKNVKALAKEKNINLGDLELQLGLHQGYFSRITKGNTRHIDLIRALMIANYFDMTIEQIIEYKTNEELLTDRLKKIAFDSILEDFRVEEVIDYLKGLKDN